MIPSIPSGWHIQFGTLKIMFGSITGDTLAHKFYVCATKGIIHVFVSAWTEDELVSEVERQLPMYGA